MAGGAAPAPTRRRVSTWLGPASVAAVFAVLLAWSFGKWTDVQIDFGTELYLSWQLTEGKVLYRDLAYRNGPLSPYVNAAVFSLFGVSIRTLVVCNLLILAGLTALLYRLFHRWCGPLAATCASSFFLCVFAFSQYVWVANYNYVTPYQHAQTHGLALGVAMIALLADELRSRRPLRLVGAGLCLGLVFLTKAELFVPAAAAAATALWLRHVVGTGAGSTGRDVLAFAAPAALPAAIAALGLAAAMPAGDALLATLGNWRYVGAGVLADPFYGWVTGAADWRSNGGRALGAGAALLSVGLAVVAADRFAGRRGRTAGPVVAAAVAALLLWKPSLVDFTAAIRALPLVAVSGAVGFAWLAVAERRARPDAAQRAAGLAVWSVYSLALLGKILLHARIPHYGFVLAMPATLLLVVVLVWWLPARARSRGGTGLLAVGLAVALLLSAVVFWLRISQTWYAAKSLAVAEGGDRIWVEAPPASLRGLRMVETLAAIEAASPPDATLLVLPEGSIVNYWLRRESPSRYHLFLPAELLAYGSDRVLADLRRNPPDVVVLMHRRHGEFGLGPFGGHERFGRALLAWVRSHYVTVETIGGDPFDPRGFGVEILRRKDP